MESQEEAKLCTCFFASAFTIKGAHQTGKDRWDNNVVSGKSKPETSLIKGSVGRSSGLQG